MSGIIDIIINFWEVFKIIGAAFLIWLIAYIALTWSDDRDEKIHYEDRR